MTLTARILAELENGAGTYAEVAAAMPDVNPKSVCGTLCNLENQGRVVIIRKVERRGARGGRRENVYALPGTHPSPKPEKRAVSDSEPIADGAYAMATRRIFPNVIFPGKGSRRGL